MGGHSSSVRAQKRQGLINELAAQQALFAARLFDSAGHPTVLVVWPLRVDAAMVVSPKQIQVERGVVVLCYEGTLRKSPVDERFRRSLPHIRARDALELAR